MILLTLQNHSCSTRGAGVACSPSTCGPEDEVSRKLQEIIECAYDAGAVVALRSLDTVALKVTNASAREAAQ